MANIIGGSVLELDTAGSIKTTGVTILWIMHYAAADNGVVEILDAESGLPVFYYKNVAISVLGNYQFFNLGGQHAKGLYLNTLTASNKVWVGLK